MVVLNKKEEKMKKKLLSVFMAAALSISCFSAVPIISQAATYTSGDFSYSLDGGCTITGYTGSDTDVVIPSELDGYTVLNIGDSAFSGNKNITSVNIPDTVQTINSWSFQNCSNLSNVDFGNSVSYLGSFCFLSCTSLKEIKLPNSLQRIGSSCFKDCSSLSDVDLGKGVSRLDFNCFSGCDSLTSINLPASITTSDAKTEKPFYGCKTLKTVTIASGGEKIPDELFAGCSGLQNITIPEGIQSIGEYTFQECESLKEITIADSVQTISSWCFFGCSSLKEIILPKSIKEIGSGAIKGCSALSGLYDYGMETKYPSSLNENAPILTIHGFEGSNAQKYANSNNVTFVLLPEKQMHRLYNKNSGEHFYTSNNSEKKDLFRAGWKYEEIAWIAPESSNTPVYRVYNPNSGEHHYTTNVSERNNLVSIGWKNEGIGWYSDDNKGTPLYRLYNPNATGQYEAGGHHYTSSVAERDNLKSLGWRDEGIGWYGTSKSQGPRPDSAINYPEKLITYLKDNGVKSNSSYGILIETPIEGSLYQHCIIYDTTNRQFTFYRSFNDGEGTIEISMSPTDSVKGTVPVYYDFKQDSFQQVWSARMSIEEYNNEELKFNTSGPMRDAKLEEGANGFLREAMSTWNLMISDWLGFGMTELGFKSYTPQ